MSRSGTGAEDFGERLLAFACGLPERLWKSRGLAMFKVFIDDSGSHVGAQRYVLAGYIAPIARWLRFTRDWDLAMKAWGLRSFHMTDAEARRGPYRAWSDADRESRVGLLSSYVAKHATRAVAAEMSVKDFETFVRARTKDVRAIDRIVGEPYNLMAQVTAYILSHACDAMKIGRDRLEVMFAQQHSASVNHTAMRCALDAFAALGLRHPNCAMAGEVPALQAADMYAWLVHRHGITPDPSSLRPRHRALVRPGRTVSVVPSDLLGKFGDALWAGLNRPIDS